jgi:multimeric flavodoxin WrbA
MKVLGIIGSPRRNGNVEALVNATLEAAGQAGMATEVFHLNDMNLQGCVACYRCKTDGVCKFDDDIWKVLTAMQEADAVVIGAPIYYFQLCSQMRTLIDRSFAFLRTDHSTRWKPGKRIVFITSQGNKDADLFARVHGELNSIFGEWGGFVVVENIIMSGGNDPSAVMSRTDLLESAKRAGEKLAMRH